MEKLRLERNNVLTLSWETLQFGSLKKLLHTQNKQFSLSYVVYYNTARTLYFFFMDYFLKLSVSGSQLSVDLNLCIYVL